MRTPIRYLLDLRRHVTADCVDWSDFDAWVVRDNVGNALNKSGEWEWEPQSSSRTDEFRARTRFATIEEAEAVYIESLTKGVSDAPAP